MSPTKQIRRSEAFTSSPSPPLSRSASPSSPAVPASEVYKSFPGVVFDYEEKHLPDPQCGGLLDGNEANGEIYEFRLFASKARPTLDRGEGPLKDGGLAKVNLRSPTPLSAQGHGGFAVPFRPQGYYFVTTDGAEGKRRRKEFADVAVDGEEVMSRARSMAWPGAALPWRVIRLSASGLAQSLKTVPSSSESQGSGTRKRVRAGKKGRIATRKKHAVEARAAETEKEKRARKNREKKLKKREKNRKLKELGPEKESVEVPD